VLFPNVVVYECVTIGNRVRIHGNTVIGSDGFGYAPRREEGKVVGLQKIYHLGRVVIEDDAELGACVTIDRGTFGETRLRKGAKLDNQVHLGHNTAVGESSAIAGGTCLAGRASVGRFAQVGGLTGVGNQVHIGDGAQVGALAMVTKDVPAGGTAVGNPQRDYRTHFKVHALLNKLLEDRSRKLSGDSQS
jgi:UDP-3-O-[3-hydroxymyristoyl] glucosamine N-acyltransferase